VKEQTKNSKDQHEKSNQINPTTFPKVLELDSETTMHSSRIKQNSKNEFKREEKRETTKCRLGFH
jgi:hypothetical protein